MIAYLLHLLLEGIAVTDSAIFHLNAVVTDGIRAIAEQFGYLGAAGDTEEDEGEDTHLDRHSLSGLGLDTSFRFEQRIEVLDERAVEREESVVKRAVEILHLAIHEGRRVFLPCPARHGREATDIIIIHLEVTAYILLFDFIRLFELAVEGMQFLILRRDLLVEIMEPAVLAERVSDADNEHDKHKAGACYGDGHSYKITLETMLVLAGYLMAEDIGLDETRGRIEERGIGERIIAIAIGALEVTGLETLFGDKP